ncbi:MAG: replication-associated recombination protein A [Candidatus Sumerlaeaceae bacterium]|nr:replication-associated recombination protein A [Candidatus Sumerlaeaceae bacterium]
MDLFGSEEGKKDPQERVPRPLADRMRPRSLEEFCGQQEVLGANSPLRRLLAQGKLRSMIFWGPPGCGKTTLALLLAKIAECEFTSLSAVTASVREVREVMERARINRNRYGRRTLLFIDEIHRFNKAQQDAFLPFVEDGSIILVGATTENPSFSVIAPLLSRCEVVVLQRLSEDDLCTIMERALTDAERGLGKLTIHAPPELLRRIAELSDGDARRALNLLELCVEIAPADSEGRKHLTPEILAQALRRKHLFYDKEGEEHYNLISALHKAMRGSDPQAALYWAQRMLSSGEDPLYLARRMIRFASEDVGNADPQALGVALAAREAYTILGSPEGELALLQCVVYLATAPKSNALYVAEARLKEEIERTGALPVPLHLRNAPTRLMRQLGYGAEYVYDHETPNHFAGQEFLPAGLQNRIFYQPGPFGFEREIAKRMAWWEKKRKEMRQKTSSSSEPPLAPPTPSDEIG